MKRLILNIAYALLPHWLLNVQSDTNNRVGSVSVFNTISDNRNFNIKLLARQVRQVQRNTNPVREWFEKKILIAFIPECHSRHVLIIYDSVNSFGNHKLFAGNYKPATFP